MTVRNLLKRVFMYIVVAIISCWILFPIYWLFVTSIKQGSQLFTWPPTYFPFPPTLDNYITALTTRPIFRTMANSLIVMVVATTTSLLISLLGAFSLARFHFRGREAIHYGILITRMLPGMVIAVPLFLMFHQIGLSDSLLGLIIAYTAFNVPLGMWMLSGFFEDVPSELQDAAMIDGCNAWQLCFRIIVPLAAPGVVASLIFTMLTCWNEFQFALILTYTVKSQTLPIIVTAMWSDRGILFGQLGAAGMTMILPVIAVSFFLQRYLVQGLTAGAVKG